MSKKPKIVAELGRPETPAETAARKAENSRLYKSRKTINNLVYSLLVTVGLVAVIYFLVPRADGEPNWQVDYVAQSEIASKSLGESLLVPAMPEQWRANAAELRNATNGQVTSWYIGFITPSDKFIAFNEAFDANETWVANELKDYPATGTVTIDGQQWTVYDNRSMNDAGNVEYAMVTTLGRSTVVLYGTADDAEFEQLATSITADLRSEQ
ncbi:MAG: DUF4245 domain-containing protein [Aurantimicrobium sp.]|uniref:DUF4245 domain-containing protein n=2 Tax=Aurantimicrobium TaxID=1705353 RepID=A0A2Z3S768_9MICO|nr:MULTISPECIES: DUF4245 domain-containing protein [Aurantimicrobium]AWR21852.1 hypothetical protein AURMO_01260 [Aurantimicrobium photophilum]MDH6410303.1 hypothetical protein [Aurantimicrobium minutum]